jgi:hypothetical protein
MANSTGPTWFDITQGGIAIVLAIFIAFVAFRQWQTARNKLKLDLFDRRWRIYDGTRDAIAYTLRENHIPMQQYIEFAALIQDADFLFNEPIHKYLQKIKEEINSLTSISTRLSDNTLQDRDKLIEIKYQKTIWLSEQFVQLKERCGPFFRFPTSI